MKRDMTYQVVPRMPLSPTCSVCTPNARRRLLMLDSDLQSLCEKLQQQTIAIINTSSTQESPTDDRLRSFPDTRVCAPCFPNTHTVIPKLITSAHHTEYIWNFMREIKSWGFVADKTSRLSSVWFGYFLSLYF